MGQDFAAVIHYDGDLTKCKTLVSRFEKGFAPDSFTQIVDTWQKTSFSDHDRNILWQTFRVSDDKKTHETPSLPDTTWALRLMSDVYLLFGEDTIGFYHLLRWRQFLTNSDWNSVMVNAVKDVCHLFKASDCILVGDYSEAWGYFLSGSSYADILKSANNQDGGEVTNIADMYVEYTPEDSKNVAFKPIYDEQGNVISDKVVFWSHDKSLPDGWSRPTVWESRGYWRLPLGEME
ncbi:MAG: hypothetical protein AAF846_01890 [Chloroflexota bacterium]